MAMGYHEMEGPQASQVIHDEAWDVTVVDAVYHGAVSFGDLYQKDIPPLSDAAVDKMAGLSESVSIEIGKDAVVENISDPGDPVQKWTVKGDYVTTTTNEYEQVQRYTAEEIEAAMGAFKVDKMQTARRIANREKAAMRTTDEVKAAAKATRDERKRTTAGLEAAANHLYTALYEYYEAADQHGLPEPASVESVVVSEDVNMSYEGGQPMTITVPLRIKRGRWG